MLIAQITFALLVLAIVYKTIIAYKKREFLAPFTIAWLTLWLILLFFIIQPSLLINIARELGISRGVDLGIYLSIIILFYLVYKIYAKLNSLDKNLTQIIRHLALNQPPAKKPHRR